MKVYYIIPLNYLLTWHPQNLKFKLYLFEEILNLWYNIILKLLFHVSSKITNFQMNLLFNPNLDLGYQTPVPWFFFKNSETIKAKTLAFCSN